MLFDHSSFIRHALADMQGVPQCIHHRNAILRISIARGVFSPVAGLSTMPLRSALNSPAPSYAQQLADGVARGDRLSVSKAITLCESTRPQHAQQAAEMLRHLDQLQSQHTSTFRVGITGPPGAGKSCLMETLGLQLLQAGHRVAVLAVDPSSEASGGAILGDKLRMPRLATADAAYVRPSPARGSLGGATRATADAVAVVEAAGFDRVLIETVGLGQSETAFSELVDCTVLVLPPIGGDEWQAMKKGIMEVVDIVAVNKADGPGLQSALTTVAHYTGAMSFIARRHRHWAPKVLAVSAKTGYQVSRLAELLEDFREELGRGGAIEQGRARQRARLFWMAAEGMLLERFRGSGAVADAVAQLLPAVARGELTPRAGAERAVARFMGTTDALP